MRLSFRHVATILALALLGWALCGAVMFGGITLFSIDTAINVHAVAAPVIFSAISWLYFRRLRYTAPLTTATVFTLTVITLDFFIVALLINRSFDMFRSVLGTWIPFGLIFLSTLLTGSAIKTSDDLPNSIRSR